MQIYFLPTCVIIEIIYMTLAGKFAGKEIQMQKKLSINVTNLLQLLIFSHVLVLPWLAAPSPNKEMQTLPSSLYLWAKAIPAPKGT